MKKFALIIIIFWVFQTHANEIDTPKFLYKILSLNEWADSQDESVLQLTEDEVPYIHFVEQDQIERALDLNWSHKPAVILKIDTSALDGDLVYETDRFGLGKYFNLYFGVIPLYAVVEAIPWQ